MKSHKFADIFPMLDGGVFGALVSDIREHGQRDSVVVFDGAILDGRNRWRACEAAGVKPKTTTFHGTEAEALAFVVSVNLHRRHLDESQRAMVAARIAALPRGANQHASIDACSQAAAAEQVNASRGSVQRARQVLDHGAPELARAVDAGLVSVSAASDVASAGLTHDEQREIVAHGEREILARAKEIRSARGELRRQERVEKIVKIAKGNAPLAPGATAERYPLVYADPPWRYEHAESESRAIENQYPTMSLDDICALPLADITTDDAILFMWTTSPKLEEGMRVVREWGFTYRTCMVWDKEKIGMGYYARQQHELLLIATKGAIPVPPPSARPGSVVRITRGDHSAKPHEFYELIERMYPELPKLEMFCRSPRAGWSVWGNQSATAAE